jgi:membrane AbrB-like protein
MGVGDALLLLACGFGVWPARRLRMPAPWILGPMFLSALVHLTGLTASKPPAVVIIVAMVVMGASIGSRFRSVPFGLLVRTLVVSLGMSLILLAIAAVSAALLHAVTGLPFSSLLLAYAPGGFAEMSMISLAMGLDPAFVSSHHMARVILIVALVPIAFRLMGRWAPLPSIAAKGDDD